MSDGTADKPVKQNKPESTKKAGAAPKKAAAKPAPKKTTAKKTVRKKPSTKKAEKPDYSVGTLHSIPIQKFEGAVNQLRSSKFSARYYQALATSMSKNGYQPIDVYIKDGKFHISDGFTRYEAFRRTQHYEAFHGIQQKEINCIIIPPEKALANALHKAMMRNDLTALERAEAFQRYMDESEPKKTAADLATEFRKSPTNISQTLSVLRLPEGIRNAIKGKPFTLRDLLELVKLEGNTDEQWMLYNDINNKRKALTDEKIQYGSDILADELDDEDDSDERRSEDENADSGLTEKPKKTTSGKGEGKGRKTRFEAIEHKIVDVSERIKGMLTIEESTSTKGPKKEPLTEEQKATLKTQLEDIIKILDAPAQTPAEPETVTEASDATPETPEPPKEEV